jgi:ABC-type antimicrobial peptide transport system permease subunit
MALGTTPSAVVRLVLSRVAMLVAGGLLVGTMVSWWATQFAGAMLYNLAPRDLPTIVGAIVTLATVAAISAWLPARRASRIDPASVMRET